MKMLLSISLLVLFSSSASVAASYYPTPENECTPVDFRDTLKLNMRNQGKSSWCFANAAADYLQYAYKLNEQVSAADIAINYSQTSVSKLIHFFQGIANRNSRGIPAQTGFIKIAVSKIVPQGYCPESALPSGAWTQVANDGTQTEVEIIASLRDTVELEKQVKNGSIKSAAELPRYYKFKNINREDFYDLLKYSKKNYLFSNLRLSACKNERKPFGSELLGSDFQVRGKYVFNNMNYTFNKHMPVTIDFFSDVFRNFDNPKRNISELHTVLVYGRKFDPNTQQCSYMLKDSYGEQCTKYDPKISCEGGYVWLPENKLFRAMTSQLILYH